MRKAKRLLMAESEDSARAWREAIAYMTDLEVTIRNHEINEEHASIGLIRALLMTVSDLEIDLTGDAVAATEAARYVAEKVPELADWIRTEFDPK